MSNEIPVYLEIRKGIVGGINPLEYFRSSSSAITVISADQLHKRIGYRPAGILNQLQRATDPLIDEVGSYYDSAQGKFAALSIPKIQGLATQQLGNINRAALPRVVKEIGVSNLDTPAIQLMQIACFQTYLDFVVHTTDPRSERQPNYTTEQIWDHFGKRIKHPDPIYESKLEHNMANLLKQTRVLTPRELEAFTIGLMLANLTWQIGLIARYASESGNKEKPRDIASNLDLAPFNSMIRRNHEYHLPRSNQAGADILTACKLAQDAFEYSSPQA